MTMRITMVAKQNPVGRCKQLPSSWLLPASLGSWGVHVLTLNNFTSNWPTAVWNALQPAKQYAPVLQYKHMKLITITTPPPPMQIQARRNSCRQIPSKLHSIPSYTPFQLRSLHSKPIPKQLQCNSQVPHKSICTPSCFPARCRQEGAGVFTSSIHP